MIEFFWPTTTGEWLAWTSAAVTGFFGLVMMFAPRYTLRFLRLQPRPDHMNAVAEVRSTLGGFYVGIAATCILLHPQPLVYLALAAVWAFSFFGRILAVLSDRATTTYHLTRLMIEAVLAILPAGYVFGFWL